MSSGESTRSAYRFLEDSSDNSKSIEQFASTSWLTRENFLILNYAYEKDFKKRLKPREADTENLGSISGSVHP